MRKDICPKCEFALSYFYDYNNDLWKGCSNCENYEEFIKNKKDMTSKEKKYVEDWNKDFKHIKELKEVKK